jgi:hypothetical protein
VANKTSNFKNMEEKNIVLYGNIDDGPVVAVLVENETM